MQKAGIAGTDVLLVVDVHNDFCTGGALGVPGGEELVRPINRLLHVFPHSVLTQDWHPAGHASFASVHLGRRPHETIEFAYGPQILWPDHCVQGTVGAAFHPDLDTDRAELVLRKGFHAGIDSYSAFFENDRATPTGLGGYLCERGFQRIFLCGLATGFCVAWSGLDARRQGFEVAVLIDACRAIDLHGPLQEAMKELSAAGAEIEESTALF
ncbi:bifunctional nicotinamidase/pyrazinamidase [Lutibaculum baratangense]|uniref:Nicotinamidase n=1 Tax=Lutibaculum baratangense AMV1 TaxID=631454 RepID=V4RQQ6_9HYPH|nr:bifunctional nicotinamidase/pyrazinamidase [Lutibaculum baratangense]ESR25460.1 Nicotinamidase [Lutibaculum baratangense AMV1]